MAEAVERIVPRRRLVVEPGDICIARRSAGLRATAERHMYGLSQRGHGPLPGRFALFDQAVAAGDDIARTQRVRLFYQGASGQPPQLLRDYRPKRR